MSKESKWLEKRVGKITASELGSIVSKSGKIIDGNLSYIRSKRFERNHGFSLPVSSYEMEQGKLREPYAIAWYRAHFPHVDIIYSQEQPEIPFWENELVPNFGASPDAYTADETVVIEIKNVVSPTQIEFFFDPATSYEEKKAKVVSDHLEQLLGQFVAKPSVSLIKLVKYCAQDDNIEKDYDSPLADWRGIVFEFDRKDYEESIKEITDRIRLFNALIDSKENPSAFKTGEWYVGEDGKLEKK